MNFAEHHARLQQIIAREIERRNQPPDGPPADYQDALDLSQEINRAWHLVEDIEDWHATVEWDQIAERYVVCVNGESVEDFSAKLSKHVAKLAEFLASL